MTVGTVKWIDHVAKNLLCGILEIMEQIGHLEYWRRVWIVQELLFSKNIVLQYGGYCVSIDEFSTFWLQIRGWLDAHHDGSRELEALHLLHSPSPIPISRLKTSFTAPGDGHLNISDWLKPECRKTRCLDPRDKVFGFYNCFRPEVKKLLTVDYGRDIGEVYSEMTRAIIKTTGSLTILREVETFGPWSNKALPSWVPNYASGNDPYRAIFNTVDNLGVVNDKGCTTADAGAFEFLGDRILQVRGRCVATVGARSRTLSGIAKSRPSRMIVMSHVLNHLMHCKQSIGLPLQQFANMLAIVYNTGCFQSEIWRSSLLTAVESGEFSSQTLVRLCAEFYHSIPEWYQTHVHRAIFAFDHNSGMGKRVREGDFAIGPAQMMAGDKVFVIQGCPALLMLRPYGNNYLLLGTVLIPAYRTRLALEDEIRNEHLQLISLC